MAEKESFASLFEKSAADVPRAKPVRVGEKVKGTIVQIGKDALFVELDGKRQAFMELVELRLPNGDLPVKAGDTLEAQVVDVSASGEVKLGRTLGKPASLGALEEAASQRLPIEGKVTGVNKGGLEVDVLGARAFCPVSQVELKFVQDLSSYIGKTLRFLVTEIRDGGKSVVLSRRAVLQEEQRLAQDQALANVVPGRTVRGVISSVRDFGAFVDLGGIEGLIPVSELSHDRRAKAGDIVKAGDMVEVQVREVKEVTPKRPGDSTVKVTLSLKALATDPWESIDTWIQVGQVVDGEITRVADFGGFVKLAPAIEGLLHVSELSGGVQSAATVLKIGQKLTVVVQNIDKAAKRISLVPAPEGASSGALVRSSSVSVGSVVNVVVDHVETFGVFVQIEGTKGRAGRGLVPNAELGTQRGADTRKLFPAGAKLVAKVLESGEGRMRLSLRAVKDDEERAQYDGYRAGVQAQGSFGTFGDLLGKAAKK